MFRHIVEYDNKFYIRKLTFRGWGYWHFYVNRWYHSVDSVPGKETVADLELRWKLRGYQFIQWI